MVNSTRAFQLDDVVRKETMPKSVVKASVKFTELAELRLSHFGH